MLKQIFRSKMKLLTFQLGRKKNPPLFDSCKMERAPFERDIIIKSNRQHIFPWLSPSLSLRPYHQLTAPLWVGSNSFLTVQFDPGYWLMRFCRSLFVLFFFLWSECIGFLVFLELKRIIFQTIIRAFLWIL